MRQFRNMKVMFATPCYNHSVSMEYSVSMYSLGIYCATAGLDAVQQALSESSITVSRNKIVQMFLDEDFTHLFWIDADIQFDTMSVFRLLWADRDVMAGPHRLKNDKEQYAFNPHGGWSEPVNKHIDEYGFIDVKEAATGFMMIKRRVLLDMIKHYPDLYYILDDPPGKKCWRFFDRMVEPETKRNLPEDYAFCRRWRDIGGKVWLDSQCNLKHQGAYLFDGDFKQTMRSQGKWEPEFVQSVDLYCTDVKLFDKDYKVFGHKGERCFDELNINGKYDEFNLENLRPLISPDSVCIDAGANLGLMTLAMANLAPEGTVYAFEPDVKTFSALVKTLYVSGLKNVRATPWILGKDGERVNFVEEPGSRTSSHCVAATSETTAHLTHSIDSLKLPRVDFIKIDVEGSELDVLDGAMDTLKRCKPIVVMEFNSFAFMFYREIDPRKALQHIREIFPKVSVFTKRVGKPVLLSDDKGFLTENMLCGWVDDLLCTME